MDFRTGDETLWTEYDLARSLLLWQTALLEWLGLGECHEAQGCFKIHRLVQVALTHAKF